MFHFGVDMEWTGCLCHKANDIKKKDFPTKKNLQFITYLSILT